ncbi:ABC transporter related [Alkaliphilus metalliredigens QYMF]|uniref:ABC transporter related n=1 Tax=Alkaliphilus metalliredigens (strain QYMF) TaxID=293826 RepID=A6TKG7_ALKMQ|nr:sugar ABC transporter ATP-binding protein [Alkaliphilus metalliredigens]ABR46685.1 ABC transporter related [Alkaliphilus metalliredigens QYMF]
MFLQMKNISKNFGPVKALQDVSLEVGPGEIHGLMGENGAGKSTLMNILAGAMQPTSGEIYFNDNKIHQMTTIKATEIGIRFIHQELNVINDLKVYENLFLREEIVKNFFLLDHKKMIEKSAEIFKGMQIDIDPNQMVSELDTSRKQLVEIAKALLFQSKLIIMDEPTTALTNNEIENLFSIMRTLKKEGVSIIYISHKMPELFSICDNFTVLRDGKFISSGAFKQIDEEEATKMLVGRSISNMAFQRNDVMDETVMAVENLSCEPFFKDINFSLNKGEVIAITGLHGDGRGELAEALFGARKVTSGKVIVNGKALTLSNIRKVMKAGIGMVPRNRKERSIILDMSIKDNLSMAYFTTHHKKVRVNKKEEMERFERNRKLTDIKASDPNNLITSLSGGNQQKVIIARWLELGSDIYILDNPTQGIDVGAKYEIYRLINELTKHKKSVIIFSAEFSEIQKVADRCLVMYKGRINAELKQNEMTEVKVMYYATGSNMEGVKCASKI